MGGVPDGCLELGWSRLLGAVDATRRRRVPKALAGHLEFAVLGGTYNQRTTVANELHWRRCPWWVGLMGTAL